MELSQIKFVSKELIDVPRAIF